jgi:hypothetical protein
LLAFFARFASRFSFGDFAAAVLAALPPLSLLAMVPFLVAASGDGSQPWSHRDATSVANKQKPAAPSEPQAR